MGARWHAAYSINHLHGSTMLAPGELHSLVSDAHLVLAQCRSAGPDALERLIARAVVGPGLLSLAITRGDGCDLTCALASSHAPLNRFGSPSILLQEMGGVAACMARTLLR